MAARTSVGVGMGVTVALLIVATLGLFILSIVFYGKKTKAEKDLATLNADITEFVRDSERETDVVRRLRSQAKEKRQSLVTYLHTSLADTMGIATGTSSDTLDVLKNKIASIEGADTTSLMGVIRSRESEIASLKAANASLAADFETAQRDLENEQAKVDRLQASQQQTVSELRGQIDIYRNELDTYRGEVNTTKAFMDEQVEKVRAQAADEQSRLSDRIRRLQEENAILKSQRADAKRENALKPTDEFALVDANVVGLEPSDGNVVIGIGRDDNVVLGMTFAVYDEPSAIRPDPTTGRYPAGKGSIEVIRIDQTSSVCRVLSGVKGNPIVKGDVVANAVYDPAKVYTFLVYGNFDANGDGRATPLELRNIQAMIESWGGQVTNDLSGDIDFLVLGEPPVVPPEPPDSAPIEVIQDYIRHQRIADRYDDLFKRAQATSVPILNENRLYTLIGRVPH